MDTRKGYTPGYAEQPAASAPFLTPECSPSFIVRYTPTSNGEKIVDRAAPVISEHGSREDAETYAVNLVRRGYAEWGSLDLYANERAVVSVEIRYNPQAPAQAGKAY